VIGGFGMGHIQEDGLVLSSDIQANGPDQLLVRELALRYVATEWI
jgi:hypothetical protein